MAERNMWMLIRWSLVIFTTALCLSASLVSGQESGKVLGTIERIEGDKYVIRWADKPELRVRIADNSDEMTVEQKAIVTNAKSFLEYQYPEIKDLAKQFLVVIAGILTLSVAFSEKIVVLTSAPWGVRVLMAAIWGACFTAFAFGGAAIFLIYNAGIGAKFAAVHAVIPHFPWPYPPDYIDVLAWAQNALVAGGLAFGVALGLFVVIGCWKLVK
jgi:hypothetical protein